MHFANLMSAYFDKTYIGEDKYYLYGNVWTEYASDFLMQVFLYTAIALAAVLIAVGVLVRLKKPESFSGFLKTGGAIVCGFAVTIIVSMLALGFANNAEKGYTAYSKIGMVLIPSAILGGVCVLGILASYIAGLFGKKAFKITLISALSLFGAALIAFIVCLAVYFASGTAEDNNGAVITGTENAMLYVSTAILIAALAALALLFGRGRKKGFDTKSIAYAAVCIALSFALSYIKLFQMPQGGSITLVSLLPLIIYSYMYGVRKGVAAGAVYGILQAVQDPFIIHPAQFFLDYPVAFAAIGLAGMFARFKKLERLPQLQFALGAVVAGVLRFASHVLSGVFAFSEYSTLDNVWAYSMAYNSFVFIDLAITVAAGVIVFSVKSFMKQVRAVQSAAWAQPKAVEEAAAAEETNNTEN
ncbi:MAG: energy-coupled thiamine transporter ThiT [Clostridia bacterium]|nr:energy-coupled thiamine transporter ThiT [Clostridia bacterium]